MPRHAFILGGTGQIGLAVGAALIAAGWRITIAHRGRRPVPQGLAKCGAQIVTLDRDTPGALAEALTDGADALIDVTAFGHQHARQLLEVQRGIGALVVVSSASVYRDAAGRTLDEATQNGFPHFPEPITEAQPTVKPGDATYSTRKVALEQVLMDEATVPVIVLRPGAIHGPGSIHPREWWVVKRILDGRKAIPLARGGGDRFHTTCTLNIAAATRAALETPSSRILNIADPTALNVTEITAAIAAHLCYDGEIVKLAHGATPAHVGRTPWSTPRPIVLDTAAALAMGYAPVTTYAAAVGATCDDLVARSEGKDWRTVFPALAAYPFAQFDYEAEDRVFGAANQAQAEEIRNPGAPPTVS